MHYLRILFIKNKLDYGRLICIFVTFISFLKYMEYNSSKFDYFDLHVLINLRVFKLVKKSFA